MLILPAAPAAAVSGQQDKSIVYFSWRGNQAARSYANPANPKSTNQQAVRNAFTTLSKAWATLTDSQRTAWTTYAQNNPTKDRFGRTVTPTGLNWYIKANSNRLYMGLTEVDDAPSANAPAPLDVTFDAATVPDGISLIVPGTHTTAFAIKGLIEPLPTPAWTPSQQRSRMVAGVDSGSYKTLTTTPDQVINFVSEVPFTIDQVVAFWAITVRIADGTESLPVLVTSTGV